MGEIIENRCGVCLAHDLHNIYSFMKSLQHRGRDAAGIGAIGQDRIDAIKWSGKVEDLPLEKIMNMFNEINPEKYHTFLGHVRYATRGNENRALDDAHPMVKGGTAIHKGSHIFNLDCDAISVHNGQIETHDICDKMNLDEPEIDTEALMEHMKRYGPEKTLDEIAGSYVMMYAEKHGDSVKVLRDRHGMMPAVIGDKDNLHVIVSEDIALRKNGADIIEYMEAGSYYEFRPDGDSELKKTIQNYPQHCFFQWNYIGDSQSNIEDIGVWSMRRKLGEKLVEHIRPELDLVTYIPDCPKLAAMAYAKGRKLPFKKIFYKGKNERSFQGSNSKERKDSIENNLHIAPIIDGIPSNEYLEGKRVGMIDDSIVRGNNAPYAGKILRDQGVKDIHLISYTPPIGIIGDDTIERGCFFGINMPPDDDFIARDRTIDEISKKMGMNVHYLPYEAMMEAFEEKGMARTNLCTFCIGGPFPLTRYR